MSGFKLNARQLQAQELIAGNQTHTMLFGGSRSGKTFLHVRNLCLRALKAPNSRHVALRFRFNAIKSSILLDTFPKVMRIAFPGVKYTLSKTDWYAEFDNGSQIWFGGLDDKERTEKILGMEFATIYLNECSQIPWGSVGIAITRLAQLAEQEIGDKREKLKMRMFYDCNPPPKSHWTYKLFVEKRDPESGKPIANPDDYASFQINPQDNVENLAEGYLKTLESLSPRLQKRFLKGEFADANPNALFPDEIIDRYRVTNAELPDFVRIVVGVDPSGSGDIDNADNDAIGIIVGALGVDGNAYILEDCTVKAGPSTWGNVAVSAYDRHGADRIVGEINYGGAMVEHVIQTARRDIGGRRANYKSVTATRGKAVRAEPVSALYEAGKVRHVGDFHELEDELSAFSTYGFNGTNSPNRADALIWVVTDLFPGLVKPRQEERERVPDVRPRVAASWMG